MSCSNVHTIYMYLHMYTDNIEHCEGRCTYAHTHKVSMISGSQKKCQEKQ